MVRQTYWILHHHEFKKKKKSVVDRILWEENLDVTAISCD